MCQKVTSYNDARRRDVVLVSQACVRSGFNVDLDARRLIRFNDDEPPILMTEREKVR